MFFDTILFDLDDTLHDRNKTLHNFIRLFIQRYSYDLDAHSKQILEDTFLKIDGQGYRPREEVFTELNKILSWNHTPDLEELLSFWNTEFPKCAEPMINLHYVLDYFKNQNTKMGIVTNGSSFFQNTKIDKLGIRKYMKTIIISEEINIRKPDPKIFQLALTKIQSNPGTTLFVGDNPIVDIKGANDSGLISVWVSYHQIWRIKQYQPKLTINQISDLENL
jgi:putative hydrolase of the HAD superfamily